MRLLAALLMLAAISATAQNTLNEALNAYETGDYDQCISIATAAIESDKSAEAYLLRADAYHKQERFANALADYDFADKKGVENPQLFLNRGICRSSMGFYDASTKDLWRYLEEFPDAARPIYYLAVNEYMIGNLDDAMTFLEKSIESDDQFMPAWYLKAAIYGENGKFKKANECYAKALDLDESFDRIKMNMAILHIEQMEYDKAEDMLSELLLADPSILAEVYYYRGEARHFQKNHVGACEDWTESSKLGDKDAEQNYERICEKGKTNVKKKRRSYVEF